MERMTEAVAHTWGGHLIPDLMDTGPEVAKKCPWEPRTAASSICLTKQPCVPEGLPWLGKGVPALALLLSVLLCCCLCLFL